MKNLLFLLITLVTVLGLPSCTSSKSLSASKGGYDLKEVVTRIAIEELKLRYQTIEFDIHLDSTAQDIAKYVESEKLFTVKVDSVAPHLRKIVVTPDYDVLEEILTRKRRQYEKLVRKTRH